MRRARFSAPGLLLLALLGLVVGGHFWLAASSLVPILRDGRIEYVLLSRSPAALAVATTGSTLGLLLLHVLLSARVFREPTSFRARDLRYLTPLGILAFSFVALANLLPATYGHLFVWSYLAVDLQPWLTLAAAGLLVASLDARSGGKVLAAFRHLGERLFAGDTSFRIELAVAAVAAAFAVTSGTQDRFNLHGDEPKYFRYAENLYQGQGFDITNRKDLSHLPVDYAPPLADNLKWAIETIPRELKNAAGDLVRLVREPGFRFNRVESVGDWFVRGKTGGIYQVHTPGLGLVLFPAYFVDRHLLSWDSRIHPNFPTELFFSLTFFVLLCAAYAAVVFRFLHASTHSAFASALAALAMAVTLPIGAFGFQYYPEVAAGVVVFLLARYLLFGPRSRPWSAAVLGLLAGFLPWLHMRYAALALVLLLWVLARHWRERGFVRSFAAGWTIPIAGFGLYVYHITGTIVPTALYDPAAAGFLQLDFIGPGLIGFLFDRKYGLLPHDPLLLVAIAGVIPLARRQPSVALFAALAIISVAAPAATHGFSAAGSTPGRYLIAVLPFAGLGLVEAFTRFRESRIFGAVVIFLALVSLQTAWVYNNHHLKALGRIYDESFSGWKLNLLFPGPISGVNWTDPGFESRLLPAWLLACALCIASPMVASRLASLRTRRPGLSPAALLLLVVIVSGAAASTVNECAGESFNPEYLLPGRVANTRLRDFWLDYGCWGCLSSTRGRLPRRRAIENPLKELALDREPAHPIVGQSTWITVDARGDGDDARGIVSVDFGDGERAPARDIVGRTRIAHRYARPGTYGVVAYLKVDSLSFTRTLSVRVYPADTTIVAGERVVPAEIGGLPDEIARALPTLAITEVQLEPQRMCVSGERGKTSPTNLWVARWAYGSWRLQGPYPWSSDGRLCVPITAVVTVETSDGPKAVVPAEHDPFVVLLSAPGRRSPVIDVPAPRPGLLAGSPILVRPGADDLWASALSRRVP